MAVDYRFRQGIVFVMLVRTVNCTCPVIYMVPTREETHRMSTESTLLYCTFSAPKYSNI